MLLSMRAVGGLGASVATAGTLYRFLDNVKGTDDFSQYTNAQHQKHFLSGMHEPFIPDSTSEQRAVFDKHFAKYKSLLPVSYEEFQSRKTIAAPVYIKPLSACAHKLLTATSTVTAETVVVGGPPALISSAEMSPITYINDSTQIGIYNGSAHHLEWDSPSEGPTTLQPVSFMATQICNLLRHTKLSEVEKTGFFSWSGLDWKGWVTHPSMWIEGLRLGIAFQLSTMASQAAAREKTLSECALRCRANDAFYNRLNSNIIKQNNGDKNSGILVSGVTGSLMLGRTDEEISDLRELQADLEKEGRVLRDVTREEYTQKYGYYPASYVKLFFEKTHDKILTHDFMTKVMSYLEKKGSTIIDGRVTAVYTDDPGQGGYIEYTPHASLNTTPTSSVLVPFSKLIMSLGAQRVHVVDKNNTTSSPIMEVVCARGVAALAIAYVPITTPTTDSNNKTVTQKSLPPVALCGGVNDAVVLSGPVATTRSVTKDGKEIQQQCHAYLMKLTSGALITPNTLDETSTHYNAAMAVGLFASVRSTMECDVEAVAVWGCNRQVSQYGETHWLQGKAQKSTSSVIFEDVGSYRPVNSFATTGTSPQGGDGGIYVQLGAAGGGLTQAPAQPPQAASPPTVA